MSVYGPIVTGDDVTEALLASVKLWSPSYINEVAAQAGRERCSLSQFMSYSTADELDKFPDDQLPACIAIVPQTSGEPVRDGRGNYTISYLAGVGVVVGAMDRRATYTNVRLYTAAVRALLIQHPSLGHFDEAEQWVPFAESLNWLGETYDELSHDQSRTVAAGIVSIEVTIKDAMTASGGLQIPPNDPCSDPGNYGIVETTPLQTEGRASE